MDGAMAEPPPAEHLRDLGRALVAGFAPAEPAFLAVGDRLSETIGIFARLGNLFHALQASLDDPELSRAAEALAAVGQEMNALAAALREERLALGRLQALNGEVARHIEVIRRTIRAISMLAVNAHVSASDVTAEGEDVGSFSLRFKQLADSARATVAASATQCERLRKILDAARTRQGRFVLEHDQGFALMAGRIEACVQGMDAGRARAAEVSRAIAAASQQISADIGAVVMALQVGDITRQRLDHVAQALEILAEAGGAGPGEEQAWFAGLDAGQRSAIGMQICRLEEAQLAEALRELDGEVATTQRTLRRLAGEAEAVLALGGRGYGDGREGFAACLGALEADLDAAVALFRICQRERAEVDAAMAMAADALGQLIDQLALVERIEEDIRLVSLNTAFLCQRIGGEGKVLAVIAYELRGRALRLLEDCRGLAALGDEICAVSRRFEEIRDAHGAARMAAVERNIQAAFAPLHRGRADMAAALARLKPEGSAVEETLRASVVTLGRFDGLGRTLRALRRRLARLAEGDAETIVDRALWHERSSLFPVCYTMASERAVHAAICGIPAAETAAAAGEAVDDVLF